MAQTSGEQFATFDPGALKKKKKAPSGVSAPAAPADEPFGKKKKKRSLAPPAAPAVTVAATPGAPSVAAPAEPDYTYEELLKRIFGLLRQNNPEAGERQRRFVLRPPQVCKEGTKKTVWINFGGTCQQLRRPVEHLRAFIFAELACTGSLDGNQRLVIRGRYQPKHIENLIAKYVKEYVSCPTCSQPETTLKKENRMTFICCESCGSRRSVAPIQKGFAAQVGKRKLGRAKEGR
jgi:putative translation initiation factor aIF-2 beta subunit